MTPSMLGATGAVLAAGGIAATGVAARALFAPRSAIFGPVIARGTSQRPAVALTFDDGPWPGSTDAILDTLAQSGVRAAFFVIGRSAQAHPDLVRRAAQEGHLIGNHTFDHHRTGLFHGRAYWNEQIARTQETLERITGVRPIYFRPPMGFKSPPLVRAAQRSGCRIVAWSWRGRDGVATNPQSIIRRSQRCRAGEIMLLHDGRDPASRRNVGATAQALAQVIESMRQRGLAIERLDDMINPPEPVQTSPNATA